MLGWLTQECYSGPDIYISTNVYRNVTGKLLESSCMEFGARNENYRTDL